MDRFSRSELLLGEEAIEKLKNSKVAVFGVGGVGGYVAEGLARCAVGELTLIDNDVISLTNINRQIIATQSTIGQMKTLAVKRRVEDINPFIKVNVSDMFILPENAHEFDFSAYDYIVDAIDTVSGKLAIIENAYKMGYAHARPPKVRSGKKVAVIGSGPSGLATADQLNRRGHSVTVYERRDRVGGLLMYGIPNMKLEKHIVERKINIMKEEGVTFVTNCNVGVDVKAEQLLKEYDRVVLCCGAANPRDIKAPGRDAKGIYFAVDFLTATTKSLLDSNFADKKFVPAEGKNVLVIGGGDTGNDCVGTSIRLGCKSVTQLEMMPKLPDTRAENNPWPIWPRVCKTDYGQQEAIAKFGHDPRIYQTTVQEFIKDKNGNVKQAKIVKLESKKDEKTGRMMMVPVEGSEFLLDVDLVLIAAGFLGSQEYVTKAFGVNVDGRTNVATEPGKHATNVKNVFTAGDMHMGQSLVVRAIREGRDVAREVDESLMGYTNL